MKYSCSIIELIHLIVIEYMILLLTKHPQLVGNSSHVLKRM